jgi:hypothetical protein
VVCSRSRSRSRSRISRTAPCVAFRICTSLSAT